MLTITLVGKEALIARISSLTPTLISSLRPVMERLGAKYVALVKRQYLSGSPLKNRTGTLRRSISYNVVETADSIVVQAGSRGISYARYHEYGFHGVQHVRAHARHVTQVFGRPWDGTQHVGAHDRTVNYAGRPFMRPSLLEFRPVIREQLEAAIRGLRI